MTAPLVSVVIPAFNEEKGLPECVTRIRAAFGAHPAVADAYELIVCDNNSTDRTAAIARDLGCGVVFEPVNQISRARNTGGRAASGEWLMFVDADSWPPPGLVGDVVPLLSDPRCIGCGSTIKVVDGPRWFKLTWESKNWSMRTFGWCPGAFIVCRRDAFVEVGGFAEDLYIFEELDFVRRLQKLGAVRHQKFLILHRHPFSTSGRRAVGKSPWWWARFALRLMLFHARSIRDKNFASAWYKGER